MGNIVPRARIESICLAFWASILIVIPPRPPDVTTLPPMLTCLGGSMSEGSVQTITILLTYLLLLLYRGE